MKCTRVVSKMDAQMVEMTVRGTAKEVMEKFRHKDEIASGLAGCWMTQADGTEIFCSQKWIAGIVFCSEQEVIVTLDPEARKLMESATAPGQRS